MKLLIRTAVYLPLILAVDAVLLIIRKNQQDKSTKDRVHKKCQYCGVSGTDTDRCDECGARR